MVPRTKRTEPLITDRPDFTESAVSVSPGGFQLETGYTFSGVEREKTHSFGEVLLRVGVAERLELRFGFNSYSRVRTGSGKLTGLEDTSFGLKLELVEGDPGTGVDRPDVAVLVSTSLPTGSDAFSADGLQPSVAVALAWDLTESLALGSNLGYSMLRDGGETFDELLRQRCSRAGSQRAFRYLCRDLRVLSDRSRLSRCCLLQHRRYVLNRRRRSA